MSRPFAVADAETDPFKFKRTVRPFIWGFYDGRTFRSFRDTADFVRFVRKFDGIVYAHNGGKFDWRLIEAHIDPGPVKVIGGRIAECRIGKAILRDSFNIFPMSLDAITGAKTSIDYRKMEKRIRERHMGEIREYLSNDCVILWDALDRFFQEYGRPLTIAGSTFREARRMGYEIPKFGPSHFQTFEPFYHGGRCQAIAPGVHKGAFWFLDINSAYAHAMTFKQWHGPAAPAKRMSARHYERGLFHITADSQGAFPQRVQGGGLEFPHVKGGEFFITGRELATALDLRVARNVKIIRCFRLPQWVNFGEYVAHFGALRDEAKRKGDHLGNVLYKLFRNGLYGKLGANPNKYKSWYLTRLGAKPPRQFADHTDCSILTNCELWSRELDPWQKTFYDVSLAAQITGHVRSIMLSALSQVRDPLYCDTDSIICRDPGRLALDDSKLGAWKIEARGDEAIIVGKKLYAFHVTGKGVKRNTYKTATKGARLTVPQIRKLAAGEEIIYRQAAQSYGLRGVRNIERRLKSTAKPGKSAPVAVGRRKPQNRRAGNSAGIK